MNASHLILYDGVCGLCNRLNQFVLKRDKAAVFHFASQQSPLGQSLLRDYGKDPAKLETFYVIEDYASGSPVLLSRSGAALFVLKTIGGTWSRLAAVFRVLPTKLLDWAYNLIARNRYRIFGRYDSCPLPTPEQRKRFVDV